MRGYALAQFAALLACTVHLLQVQRSAPAPETLGYLAFVAAGLVGVGGLLEGRRGFAAWEVGRNAATALAVLALGRWFGVPAAPAWVVAAIAALAAGGAVAAWIAGRRIGAAPVAAAARA